MRTMYSRASESRILNYTFKKQNVPKLKKTTKNPTLFSQCENKFSKKNKKLRF